jgi:hypothetical protein
MSAASLRLAKWSFVLRPSSFVLLSAALFTAMFLVTALPRVVYPYDLDFIEDGIVMQALRVAQGLPVYVAPNADFNPHVYMPLYFWLGGLLLKLGGPPMALLRALSFTATLSTTVLIYVIARRESGRGWIGLGCAGLFLGGYRINGFWYEIARVDSLFVTLLVGGLALGIYAGRSRRRLALAGLVLALAFLTKQTGLVVGAGLGVYLLAAIGRRAAWFGLPYLALCLAPLFLLNAASGGWFFYHIFGISSGDPVLLSRVVNFVLLELFGVMLAITLAALVALALEWRRAAWRFWLWQPWLLAIGLAVAISLVARSSVGGNLNNRMPAYALLCLAPALLARYIRPPAASAIRAAGLNRPEWALAAVFVFQFGLGVYNPARYIPSPAMTAAGGRLIARIAATPGPVLVMMHPYYALLAGKEPATQIAALWYVRGRGAQPLPADLVARLQSQHYAEIISDESEFETDPALYELLLAHYEPVETLDHSLAPPAPVGVHVRPQVVYRPRVQP